PTQASLAEYHGQARIDGLLMWRDGAAGLGRSNRNRNRNRNRNIQPFKGHAVEIEPVRPELG
ncbi:hypothetical protein ACVBEH_14515, partial [Roseateles sp. GG27B]